MTLPRLYAILDVEVCTRIGHDPMEVVDAWLEAGVRLVQLRAKTLASGPLCEMAAAVTERVAAAGGLHVLNDRADLAVLARAHGVHVGQDDLPVEDARRIVGPDALVGVSTHGDAQLAEALATSASYVAVGPVFGTSTKDTGYAPVGLDFVRRAALAARVPVVAIGGITLERAPSVVAAGAAAAAVISDLHAGDPGARARAFLAALV